MIFTAGTKIFRVCWFLTPKSVLAGWTIFPVNWCGLTKGKEFELKVKVEKQKNEREKKQLRYIRVKSLEAFYICWRSIRQKDSITLGQKKHQLYTGAIIWWRGQKIFTRLASWSSGLISFILLNPGLTDMSTKYDSSDDPEKMPHFS